VLFPTNDTWAAAIAHSKEMLSHRFVPCVADYDTIQLLLDKRRFEAWTRENGYPVPRCWTVDELAEVPAGAFPLVAKPTCRRNCSNDPTNFARSRQYDRLRLTILATRRDMQSFVANQGSLVREFLFQEYVHGLSDCMYTVGVYVDSSHQVRAMFTGRKVRGFPPVFGNCIVGEAHSVPQEVKQIVRRMCSDLRYEGIAEFEFKRDAQSGEFKLIEVNPRSWSWIGITPACGVSLAWIAYSHLTGLPCSENVESIVSDGTVKWVVLFDDFRDCVSANRRAGFPEWHMGVRKWLSSLRAERLVHAEWAADDLAPWFVALWRFLCGLGRALRRRVGI
jgi:predicted ATP-grasp superfamily ATP-dependent carboligase